MIYCSINSTFISKERLDSALFDTLTGRSQSILGARSCFFLLSYKVQEFQLLHNYATADPRVDHVIAAVKINF